MANSIQSKPFGGDPWKQSFSFGMKLGRCGPEGLAGAEASKAEMRPKPGDITELRSSPAWTFQILELILSGGNQGLSQFLSQSNHFRSLDSVIK